MNAEYRIRLIIYFVAGALLFSGGYLLGEQNWANSETWIVGEPTAQASDALIGVDVKGAVASPGFYQVKVGSRVAEVVKQAKPLAEADLGQLNQAEYVEDGQEIDVPFGESNASSEERSTSITTQVVQEAPTSTPKVTKAKPPTNKSTGPININTANAKQLETLPGIGPALAQRIIDYRETEGSFQSNEDLTKVKGIGTKRLADLQDKITY